MSTRAEFKEWLENDGKIDRTLWSAQSEAWEHLENGEENITVFQAGYRSGKSILGAKYIIEQAIKNPGGTFLVLAVSYSEGNDSTFKILKQELPGKNTQGETDYHGPEQSPVVADYNKTKRKITLHTGSEIILGSADKYSRYAGSEFNAIWMDEVAHYECNLYKLLKMTSTRLTSSKGPNNILMTSTGEGLNQYHDFITNDESHSYNFGFIKAKTENNPFLDEQIIETLKRQHSHHAEQALHGGFISAENLVYDIHEVDEVKNRPDLNGDYINIYGVDYGWEDYDAALQIYYYPNSGTYYVHNEYYENQTMTERLYDWLSSKETGKVYTEWDPEKKRKLSKKSNHKTINADKNIMEGVNEVQLQINKGNLIINTSNCTNLYKEMSNYQHQDKGSASADDHALDALRYAIYSHAEKGKWGEDSFGVSAHD